MVASLSFSHFSRVAQKHPSSDKHRLVISDEGRIGIKTIPGSLFGRAHVYTAEEKLENKRAVVAFKRVIDQAPVTPNRLKKILDNCRSYGQDFDKMAEDGAPLTPVDVEKAGVAASILTAQDIGGKVLRRLSAHDIGKRIERADPFHYYGTIPEDQWYHGGPTTFQEYIGRNHFLVDRRLLRIFSLNSLLYQHPHAFAEHLSKGLLSCEPAEGTIVPAPDASFYETDFYKVEKKIETKEKGGLFALMLTPVSEQSKLSPILGFRPTQMKIGYSGPLASLKEDTEKEIGKKGYEAAKADLKDAIDQAGDGLIGVGYSKGGSELARCFIDHWQHFNEVIFFNDPSIEKNLVEDFAKMINALPRQDKVRTITIYRTKNDITHFGGEKHVGWGIQHPDFKVKVVEIEHPSYDEQIKMYHLPKLLERHAQRHFLKNEIAENSIFKVYEGKAADAQLDNTQRGAHVASYETFRQKWGKCIFRIVNCFYKFLVLFLSCLGFDIDKKSLHYSS